MLLAAIRVRGRLELPERSLPGLHRRRYPLDPFPREAPTGGMEDASAPGTELGLSAIFCEALAQDCKSVFACLRHEVWWARHGGCFSHLERSGSSRDCGKDRTCLEVSVSSAPPTRGFPHVRRPHSLFWGRTGCYPLHPCSFLFEESKGQILEPSCSSCSAPGMEKRFSRDEEDVHLPIGILV